MSGTVLSQRKEFTGEEIVGIRKILIPAVLAGDEAIIKQCAGEAREKFGGSEQQIAAIRAWLKIYPADVIFEVSKAHGIESLRVSGHELLELTQNDNPARIRALARRDGIEPAIIREMLELLSERLGRAPAAKRSLHARNSNASFDRDQLDQLSCPSVFESGSEVLAQLRRDISKRLAGVSDNMGRIEVRLDNSVSALMRNYAERICSILSEEAKAVLRALCMRGGGTLFDVENFAKKNGLEWPRSAITQVRTLHEQGVVSCKSGYISAGKKIKVDPVIQCVLAMEAIRATPLNEESVEMLEFAQSSMCMALTACSDGQRPPLVAK